MFIYLMGMPSAVPYVELRCRSAFSFLRGASLPEELAARGAALGYPALGLVDRGGLQGAPRFYREARAQGIRALVGAEIPLEDGAHLTAMVEDRRGYRNLCRLLTEGHLRAPKGTGWVTPDEVEEHAGGLLFLAGAPGSRLAGRVERGEVEAAAGWLDELAARVEGRVYVELGRHRVAAEERRNHALRGLAEARGLPLVATGQVLHAAPEDRDLLDTLWAIREATPLAAMGRRLPPNGGYYLRPPEEMARLFRDLPAALAASVEIADRCRFGLQDLGYRFPEYPVPPGETPDGFLRALAYRGARARFGARRMPAARALLEKELALIAKLGLAGYFLVVWELVDFCRREGIMVQGRGSAANSAVCFSLGITAVDPIETPLLFERFLSEERGEWPDIDLDLPSGDPRERVIQHAYERYGARGAAMTAVVITYRWKSASREVGKVLGFPAAVLDRLSKLASRGGLDDPAHREARLGEVGLDPDHAVVRHYLRLTEKIRGLPRHLGQHPGGMVLCGGRLDEVVPLENAAMPDRVVVQWDKDDCEDLGLLKVDLLGLGMMAVLENSVELVREHYDTELDLARLPKDDPAVYDMLCAADSVGVFQVESRAQMSTLPRLRPRNLYDLTVEVAIIRPGPIQGNMVHPYIERRAGRQEVRYPHPCLEPVLAKTLGVALFQEQLLQMAMVAAGFSGGKAEELRRAFSKKRSEEALRAQEGALRAGMTARGIPGPAQDEIVHAITSFASYGFPESHAASFALLVYASAYLKRHYPAAFYAALLDEWPMGFYHPATLVKDAERRGQVVRPIDVCESDWGCRIEDDLGVRLGLRYVKGLRRDRAAALLAARLARPFRDLADLRRRVDLDRAELANLARIGALDSLGETRRSALWQVSRADRQAGPLFRDLPPLPDPSPLAEMTPLEETRADFDGTELTTGPHPMVHLRARMDLPRVRTVAEVMAASAGARVRVAGAIICRQRPGTKTGVVFLSLEDETGILNIMVTAKLFEEERALIVTTPFLVIDGILDARDGAYLVKARRLRALEIHAPEGRKGGIDVRSHDWH